MTTVSLLPPPTTAIAVAALKAQSLPGSSRFRDGVATQLLVTAVGTSRVNLTSFDCSVLVEAYAETDIATEDLARDAYKALTSLDVTYVTLPDNSTYWIVRTDERSGIVMYADVERQKPRWQFIITLRIRAD